MTLFPKTISYTRRDSSYVSGILQVAETAGSFIGSIQPVNGHDLQFLPEGRMDTGSVKVYSNTPLNVSEEGTGKPGDLIQYQGRTYELVQSLPYQNGIISHYKYIAMDVTSSMAEVQEET